MMKLTCLVFCVGLTTSCNVAANPLAWAIRAGVGTSERSVATSAVRGARVVSTVEAESAEAAATRYAAKNGRRARKTSDPNVFEIIDKAGNVIELINTEGREQNQAPQNNDLYPHTVNCDGWTNNPFSVNIQIGRPITQNEANNICDANRPKPQIITTKINCRVPWAAFLLDHQSTHQLSQYEIDELCNRHAPPPPPMQFVAPPNMHLGPPPGLQNGGPCPPGWWFGRNGCTPP